MFDKILIANRGEIALRVLRACKELGIPTVAVHSTADADAMHVRFADESVCIGPPPPRTAISTSPPSSRPAKSPAPTRYIRATAFYRRTRASPKSSPSTACTSSGPRPNTSALMGDKIEAKRTAKKLGIPVVPGSEGGVGSDAGSDEDRKRHRLSGADQGCGRRRRARHEGRARRRRAFDRARRPRAPKPKPRSATTPSISRNISSGPRHIEIQVLGDGKGNAIHLGERDCSLQRRHQKVWEESPSPALNASARDAIGETVAKAMREIAYLGVGTVEFLYEDGKFYFIEMNTRIQVEHPVTEMITDIDLIFEQIRVAAGGDLHAQAERRRISRPRDRMPHQCGEPGVLPALARKDPALSSARRPRRAHRLRGLSGLHDPAVITIHWSAS